MHKPVGVIDTGSNTVLGVVFHWDEQKNSYVCRSLADGLVIHAGLIGYVADQKLSEEGLGVLSDALRQIRIFFARWDISPEQAYCFATASLRGIENFAAAAERAAAEGFRLELLSGEEEARCDFAGMLQEMVWMEQDSDASFPEKGVALDMGGGSGQVLCFTSREREELAAFQSFPIGCLALKKRFVSGGGMTPTNAELDSIRSFVLSQIEQIPMIAALGQESEAESPAFFAMGGTVKAIVRLFDHLGWRTNHPDFPGAVSLSVEDLEQAVSYFRSAEGKELVCEREPGRRETFVTGLVTLLTICRRVGAERMTVLQSGVREGYVVRHINKG